MEKTIALKDASGRVKVQPRQLQLFKAASKDTLKRVEEEAKPLVFRKGQEIVSRSDGPGDVFILLSGLARVIVFSASGKAVNFRRIDPGSLFGEFSAIDGKARSATVEAVEPCVVLSLSAALFNDLMVRDKAFMHAVLTHLVGLLRSMTGRIVEFSTLAVTNRIHSELLRMARAAHNGEGGYNIRPAPTHTEIAGRISTHREAVSREISNLKRLGIIERRGRALIVLDFPRLERMVHEASGE